LRLELALPDGESAADVFADLSAALADPERLDGSWVSFGALPPEPSWRDPADPNRRVSRQRWRLASLEPGARTLPALVAEVLAGSGVSLDPPQVDVVGVLAEGEDAPRPLAGFPDSFGAGVDDGPSFVGRALPFLVGAGLLGALLAFVFLRRREGRERREVPKAPLERLAELEVGLETRGPATTLAGLSGLVREALGARAVPACPSGASDEEWLAAVRARAELGRDSVADLEDLFARSEAVKYGGARPTRWALDETFALARRLLGAESPSAEGQNRTNGGGGR